jgi:hypothetical protein
MRFQSDVAEKVKSWSFRDAEKAKTRDRTDVTTTR